MSTNPVVEEINAALLALATKCQEHNLQFMAVVQDDHETHKTGAINTAIPVCREMRLMLYANIANGNVMRLMELMAREAARREDPQDIVIEIMLAEHEAIQSGEEQGHSTLKEVTPSGLNS